MVFVLILLCLLAGDLAAQEVNCAQAPETPPEAFFQGIGDALGRTTLRHGFYRTAYNLRIEESCKERLPIARLERFYRETMAKGEACLQRLAPQGPAARENLACLARLFQDQQNPPKILCGGWPFGNDITAVASFPGSSKRHPYLWLSPQVTGLMTSDPNELAATIFHESLHNCGHIHSEGIEITWTCEDCCFGDKLTDSRRKSACRICQGDYPDENNVGYGRDLINWSRGYQNLSVTMLRRLLEVSRDQKNTALAEEVFKEFPGTSAQRRELLQSWLLAAPAERKAALQKLAREFTESQRSSKLFRALAADHGL